MRSETSNGGSPKNPPAPASSSVRIDRSTTPIEAFETPPFSSSTALPWSHVGLEVIVHGVTIARARREEMGDADPDKGSASGGPRV